MNIAQVNIAKLRYDKESEQVLEFTSNIEIINNLAEQSEGYIWHLRESNSGANYYQCNLMLVNISIWRSVTDFKKFIYNSEHLYFIKNQSYWFTKITGRNYAIWHTKKFSNISVEEGIKRLDSLNKYGPNKYAFSISEHEFYN